jgi:outer membrane lipoprotein-sorting protein
MNRRTFLAAVGATLAFGRRAGAEVASLDELLARIARARASVKTLVGPFTQVRKIGLLAAEVRSQGTMTLVLPDKLRWELAPPDEVVYWITRDGLAYRSRSGQGRLSNDAQTAAGVRAGTALADLRTVLAGDLAKLRPRFDLKTVSTDDGTAAFEAISKAGASPRVQRIAFTIASDLVRPVRATIAEGPKDVTEITFGPLKVDALVDAATMRGP